MPLIRSKSKLLCLVLLAGMLFLSFDICANCKDTPQTPLAAHHCCIQCCPSHNLGPVSQLLIKLASSNHYAIKFHSDKAFRDQNPFLDSLYRPPIA